MGYVTQENLSTYNTQIKNYIGEQDKKVVSAAKGYINTELAKITLDSLGAESAGAAATAEQNAKNYADTQISALVDSAPETMDTLKELSDAIKSNGDAVTAINTAIATKVDKETGKGLSANDFTDAYKSAIDNLPTSYAPTNAEENVITEVKVNGTALTPSEKSVDITIPAGFSGKYDDLTDKPTLFDGDYNSLTNKPTIPTTLPASDVAAWAKEATKPTYTAAEVNADESGSAAAAETNAKAYTDQKISDLVNSAPETMDTLKELADAIKTNGDAVTAINSAITNKADKSELFSGSYNDLTDKPTIPTGGGSSSVSEESIEELFSTTQIGDTKYSGSIDNGSMKLLSPGLYDANNNFITALTKEVVEKKYTNSTSIASELNITKSNVVKAILPNNITSIGDYAFYSFSNLTDIVIFGDLLSIGDYAFSGCSYLKSIKIPESVINLGSYAFYNCTYLTSANIPSGIQSLAPGVFSTCTSLSIDVPDTVKYIFSNTFYNVLNINYNGTASGSPWYAKALNGTVDAQGLVYSDATKTTVIGAPASVKSIIVPEGVTTIAEKAFYNCKELKSLTLPSTLTYIGPSAFSSCYVLDKLDLPVGITTIEDSTFQSCKALTSLTIPEGVTTIGSYVFSYCTSLVELKLPSTLTTIKGRLCSSVYSIASIDLPSSLTSMASSCCSNIRNVNYNGSLTTSTGANVVNGYVDAQGVIYSDSNMTKVMACLPSATDVVLPSSVTSFNTKAFYGCPNLTSIDLSSTSATALVSSMFYNCTKLKTVVLPETLTSMSDSTFVNCTSLTSINIPSQVTSISSSVFTKCSALALSIPSTVTTISSGALTGVRYYSYDGSATGAPWGALSYYGQPGLYDANNILLRELTINDIMLPTFAEQKNLLYNMGAPAAKKVILPTGITKIPDYAFYGSGITSCTIPNTVTYIGNSAFRSTSLSSIDIPSSVTDFGYGAFQSSALKSVTIPSGIKTITASLFSGCLSLTSVTMPTSVTKIDTCAFSYCKALSSITIGSGVTFIGYEAFKGCESLSTVVLPASLRTIDEGAFSYCYPLTSVTMPSGITSIGVLAFKGCTRLSLTVPNSVTSIGDSAFGDVSHVTYKGTASGSPWGAQSIN